MNYTTIPEVDKNVYQYGDFGDTKYFDAITITTNKKIRLSNGWSNNDMQIWKLLGFLCDHKIGLKKCPCFVPGKLNGTQRRKANVESLSCMVFDIDNGMPISDAIEQIQKAELAACLYTTHSHHKRSSTKINAEELVAKYGGYFTAKDIINFCRETNSQIHPSVFEDCEVEIGDDDENITVHHKPIPKFRVMLILKEPFVIADQGTSLREAEQIWKGKYHSVGANLGLDFDKSCTDLSRALYSPRHEKGSDYEVHLFDGDFLDMDSIKFELKGRNSTGSKLRPEYESNEYKTSWLMKFLAKHAYGFDAESFFSTYCEERMERSNGDGFHYECPNDIEHSDAGNLDDNAFFVVSADNNDGNGFFAKCMHNSCADLDRGAFLDIVIQQYDLEWDDLFEFCENSHASLEELALSCGIDPKSNQPFQNGPLPDGFKYKKGSIWAPRPEDDPLRICGEFHFVGKASNPDGTGSSIIIQIGDGSKKQQLIYPLSNMERDTGDLLALLSDLGVTVVRSKRNLVLELLSISRDLKLPEITRVERPGYFDGHYILPSGIVVGENPDQYILSNQPNTDAWKNGAQSGWIEDVSNKIWHEGNELMQFSLLAPGAAMLTTYLDMDGFIFATTGSSSKGKTSALKIAASFSGKPSGGDESTFIKLRGTANGLEGSFAKRAGTLRSLDEFSMFQGSPTELVFMIAEGRGKARANQRGEARKVKEFPGGALISSETGFLDILEKAGETAVQGFSVRLFDLDVSELEPVSDPVFNAIVSGIGKHYGHAAELFAEAMLSHSPDELFERIDVLTNEFIADHSRNGSVSVYQKRQIKVFAMLILSGQIMLESGLIPDGCTLKVTDAVDWAWNNSAGDPNRNLGKPIEIAIDKLRYALATEQGKTLESVDGSISLGYQQTVGFYDLGWFYIPEKNIAKLAGGTVKTRMLVSELVKQGFIDRADEKKNIAYQTLPNGTKIRHYRIPKKAFLSGLKEEEPTTK